MPGLAGLITRMAPEAAQQQLRHMVGSMRHESFYSTGAWSDCSLGVYVGWTAREGSFSEAMPVHNESRDRVLVFSGEEFPEPGIAGRLKARGHAVGPDGPSYLVHLSEEEVDFPASLNGRFHGLLADRKQGTVTLFNDRYSMHRLYIHASSDAFYFAAEAKALLAVRPELRAIDPQALGEFVSCGCVFRNRTLFPEIEILPAASAWIFRNATLQQETGYFAPKEWEQQQPLTSGAYYEEIREVFSHNLPRYFNGRERVAMSLTGGLDTRMVMAWHHGPADSLPCYTFGGPFRDCQDVLIARQVAQECRQPHQVIVIGQDFLNQFPRYAERAVYLSDGCVDVTRSSDLYANMQARGIAPVRMTGNYGTEVLRWLPAMKPVEPAAGLFDGDFLTSVRAARRVFTDVINTHPASFAVFRQAPWFHYGLLALEQTQVSIRSPYLDNDLVRSVFRAENPSFPKSYGSVNNDVCLRLIADGNPALRAIRTDRGVGGNEHNPISALLRNYMEFTFRAEYAYDYGMPQWLARIDHSLTSLRLERLFLGRHKFAHYRLWYRDALSGYVREMLLDRRTLARPYLNRSRVEDVVSGHLRGNRNYTTEIHKLLTLELIHRLFVDAQ